MIILPKEAYTSKDWFEKEKQLIFGNSWQFAGFIEDVQDPGDYITVQCGNQNLMVVKGRDQRLRAFHNLCRHRGTQLLRAVGKKQKAITCPYHDWTYNLNGQLMSVPDKEKEFPDLELDSICLHKASVDLWRGMIWVHPKPNPEPITKWFEGVEEKLGPHDPTRLVEYPETIYEETINANWKIVVENYIDVYHLAHLHSHTLDMYDHAKAEYGFVGNHYLFWEPLAKHYFENLEKVIPNKRIKEMTDEYIGAYVPWLFPSVGLSETESSWSTFQVIPLAPDKTKVIVRSKIEETSSWEYSKQGLRLYSNWDKIMGRGKKYDSNVKDDPMTSGDFMAEDIFACEQQQKSLSNPLFSVVATAKHEESTVTGFQTIIQKWMNNNLTK